MQRTSKIWKNVLTEIMRQATSKTVSELSLVGCLLLPMEPAFKCSLYKLTSLETTNYSFDKSSQLKIASGWGMGTCAHFPDPLWDSTWYRLCPCGYNFCEILCMSVLLYLEVIDFLVASLPSGSYSLSFFSLKGFPETWGQEFYGDFLFRALYVFRLSLSP